MTNTDQLTLWVGVSIGTAKHHDESQEDLRIYLNSGWPELIEYSRPWVPTGTDPVINVSRRIYLFTYVRQLGLGSLDLGGIHSIHSVQSVSLLQLPVGSCKLKIVRVHDSARSLGSERLNCRGTL